MIDTKNEFFSLTGKREEVLSSLIEKIYSAAQPGVVYSAPITTGNYTVIMASEVTVGGGFGSGSGFGPQENHTVEQASPSSGGGGIGGGGSSRGRPVAIIVIGPEGVTVKPIFDFTKIILAGIMTGGAILMLLRKMISRNKHR